MKLWTTATRIPNDREHYVVVGVDDDYLADLIKLSVMPLPDLIPDIQYAVPSNNTDARVYPRTVATDAVLGALFVEGDEDLEDVIDDALYSYGSQPVGYDSFESLHNALSLAGSKANPDYCYETYIYSMVISSSGILEVPVNIQVTEEGAERVANVAINTNPPTEP